VAGAKEVGRSSTLLRNRERERERERERKGKGGPIQLGKEIFHGCRCHRDKQRHSPLLLFHYRRRHCYVAAALSRRSSPMIADKPPSRNALRGRTRTYRCSARRTETLRCPTRVGTLRTRRTDAKHEMLDRAIL